MAKKNSFFTDMATEKEEVLRVYPIAQLLELRPNIPPVNHPIRHILPINILRPEPEEVQENVGVPGTRI